MQKLLPSNVKPFDRFGASVSIDGDALVVGSHQEFEEGKLAYQRAVQVRRRTSKQISSLAPAGGRVEVNTDSPCPGSTFMRGAYLHNLWCLSILKHNAVSSGVFPVKHWCCYIVKYQPRQKMDRAPAKELGLYGKGGRVGAAKVRF